VTQTASKLSRDDVVVLRRGVRLQFESSQDRWVLLYPEGMVQLGDTALEVLKRLDGIRDINQVIRELDQAYDADTCADVIEFLEIALERLWITRNAR